MSYKPIVIPTGIQENRNGPPGSGDKTSRILFEARSKRAANARPAAASRASGQSFPLIVHSHLCWDWVWQRPQQFLSRLSARHKILFVETVGPDPQLAAPYARLRDADGFPNITILRLQFPTWQWGDGEFIDRERRHLVQMALK